MAIYTTYLAKLAHDPKMPERIGSCFVYVVTTRVNANRCVAPDWDFLEKYKKSGDWDAYEKAYLFKIRNLPDAQDWIRRRAEEAIIGNILLVCYEKDPTKCHRRLLAEEIAKYPLKLNQDTEYRGDWDEPDHPEFLNRRVDE